MVYVAVQWLPLGRAESVETDRTRVLVRAIVLSEMGSLGLLVLPARCP